MTVAIIIIVFIGAVAAFFGYKNMENGNTADVRIGGSILFAIGLGLVTVGIFAIFAAILT